MTEELQGLIDRIRNEAVDEAEKKAEEIVADARKQASQIVDKAEDDAASIKEQARKDSEVYADRARRTLEQAARDLIITVGEAVESILSNLVFDAVDEAMTIETLQEMMVGMAQQCAARAGESRIELLVSPEDEKKLVKFFASRYREKMVHGLTLSVESEILKGFRVSFQDDHVYLDYTRESLADSLSAFLRPHLAEIVSAAASVEACVDEACRCVCPSDEGGEGETG